MFKKKSTKDKVLGKQPSTPIVMETEYDNLPNSEETFPESSEGSNQSPSKKKRKKKKKEPKEPGERKPFDLKVLLHNKVLVGSICIGVSAVIAFVIMPLIQHLVSQPVYIVTASEDIKKGDAYTDSNLKMEEYAGTNIPTDAYFSINDLKGKFANVELLTGDVLTHRKVSDSYPSDDNYLAQLPPGKLAISVETDGLSSSLSSKIRKGDIVSVFVVSDTNGDTLTECPPELQSIEVLSVTNANIRDIDNGIDRENSEERQISTVTFIANPQQAQILATADAKSRIHLALKERGNAANKELLLAEQELFFQEDTEDSEVANEDSEVSAEILGKIEESKIDETEEVSGSEQTN